MQADNQLPAAERRNYKNVFNAFARISQEEGILGLWRGATPTVIRAVVLNLAMLASYDEVKERTMEYLQSKETMKVRILYISIELEPV
jgi:solute carrier family 25 oxoglutarate transporter 11